ncbi:MAG TPA: hypothetical protein VHK01_07770 [Lacipirellulaceae bacterium]|jgi:hypothetical protein|nr:hypothetical protein [Lacipirellulaceae bacterium]
MARSKRPVNRPDVNKLLNQFAAEEQEFLGREFLAPALRGGMINVRISGVLCRMRTTPADFEGWGVFRPTSHTEANLVRQASLAERRNYLALFQLFRLIVCRRAGNTWFGSAASFGDARINIEGMAPLRLAEEVQLFDCVRSRYDGSQFWFEERDMRHDPGASAYLRAALAEQTPPQDLERHGLTAEERAAYELNYWQLVQPPEVDLEEDEPQPNALHRRRSKRHRPGEPAAREADPVRRRLRESLSHAGAQLVDYLERGDSFRVRYRIGGREYTSSVDKADLSVQVAGICLSGEDEKFDLASLVGVLREAGGGVLRIGDEGMDEEQYWRVHPPRNH